MHTVFDFVMGAYLSVLSSVSQLAHWFGELSRPRGGHAHYTVAAVVVTSLIVALISAIWAVITKLHSTSYRQSMRAALSRAQADIRFREAMITACPEAIAVLGSDIGAPLSYRGGAALLQACLDGPDAATLAARLETLLASGAAFTLTVRTASFPSISVRGSAVGARAALFFRIEETANKPQTDFCSALETLPLPAWIRNRHLVLTWANKAFLDATGATSLRDAQLSDATLDPSERDLARTASDGVDVIGARRYAVIDGERRALSLDLRHLPDKGIAGFAIDETELARAEAQRQLSEEAFAAVLNTLDAGVAIFGADQRLISYNAAYLQMWHLPESWLNSRPTLGDVLDRLRELRRVPEQRNFTAWKQEHLQQFVEAGQTVAETWHLPTGMSVDVHSAPYLPGGVVYMFHDISEQLRMEANHQLLIQSQRAMLNTISDAMALFGTDGRLKIHNESFAKLWRIDEDELAGQPHLSKVADLCAARIGRDGIWSMISAGVNAAEPERLGEWGQLARADGRSMTLSMSRMPDGATLVSFTDLTDLERFEAIVAKPRIVSAA